MVRAKTSSEDRAICILGCLPVCTCAKLSGQDSHEGSKSKYHCSVEPTPGVYQTKFLLKICRGVVIFAWSAKRGGCYTIMLRVVNCPPIGIEIGA